MSIVTRPISGVPINYLARAGTSRNAAKTHYLVGTFSLQRDLLFEIHNFLTPSWRTRNVGEKRLVKYIVK